MTIDRATSHQLANEIISLLPDEEFRKHWPAAMAAMVLFARNMSEEHATNAADIGDLVEKNLLGMRVVIDGFHAMCAKSSAEMRENNTSILRDEIAGIVMAAKAQFTAEVLKSTAEQLSCLNQEIRINVGIEVRKALEVEMDQVRLLKKGTADATNVAMAKLVARLEEAVETVSRMDRERQLQKGFFQKLKELFFGEDLPVRAASKNTSQGR